MTQQELAKAAGVSPGTIVRLEAGSQKPHYDTVNKLAGALYVSPVKLGQEEGWQRTVRRSCTVSSPCQLR
jgi:transcriptional regulator with XRE-family HTH domain